MERRSGWFAVRIGHREYGVDEQADGAQWQQALAAVYPVQSQVSIRCLCRADRDLPLCVAPYPRRKGFFLRGYGGRSSEHLPGCRFHVATRGAANAHPEAEGVRAEGSERGRFVGLSAADLDGLGADLRLPFGLGPSRGSVADKGAGRRRASVSAEVDRAYSTLEVLLVKLWREADKHRQQWPRRGELDLVDRLRDLRSAAQSLTVNGEALSERLLVGLLPKGKGAELLTEKMRKYDWYWRSSNQQLKRTVREEGGGVFVAGVLARAKGEEALKALRLRNFESLPWLRLREGFWTGVERRYPEVVSRWRAGAEVFALAWVRDLEKAAWAKDLRQDTVGEVHELALVDLDEELLPVGFECDESRG